MIREPENLLNVNHNKEISHLLAVVELPRVNQGLRAECATRLLESLKIALVKRHLQNLVPHVLDEAETKRREVEIREDKKN